MFAPLDGRCVRFNLCLRLYPLTPRPGIHTPLRTNQCIMLSASEPKGVFQNGAKAYATIIIPLSSTLEVPKDSPAAIYGVQLKVQVYAFRVIS